MHTYVGMTFSFPLGVELAEIHTHFPQNLEKNLVKENFNCHLINGYQVHWLYRPYAYDVTEGRPAALGVKRNTATCVIAKHAARGANPASHTAGLARPGPCTERLSANAHCQHNTCTLRDTRLASLLWRCDPLWRQCIRSIDTCITWNHLWFSNVVMWYNFRVNLSFSTCSCGQVNYKLLEKHLPEGNLICQKNIFIIYLFIYLFIYIFIYLQLTLPKLNPLGLKK